MSVADVKPPVVVTGHGRSGTRWLATLLNHFVDARHEPDQLGGDVVVSCRLVGGMPGLAERHRTLHLVRDGRDVVRSTFEFYRGARSFADVCEGWRDSTEACRDLETVRLEDLLAPVSRTARYRLPHWSDWPDDLTALFWETCGAQMARHGYGEEA